MLINFTQQLTGTLKIIFYILILYVFMGDIVLSSLWGRLSLAIGLGLFIAYIQYGATTTLANNLLFEPAGQGLEAFNDMIRECEFSPESIRIRYGYSQGSIALSMLNTISLDPMVWTEKTEHTSIKKARETIDTFIMPSVPQEQKEIITFIKETITPASQNFIFRHELGHTANHCSLKKIALTGCIIAAAVFIGTSTVAYLMPLTGGILASLLGTIIGSMTDIVLSTVGNVVCNYNQEKEADRFAARYSNQEEIKAAAELFEKHQDFLDSTMSKLDRFYTVTKYVSGNFDGKERAAFLRNLAEQKTN